MHTFTSKVASDIKKNSSEMPHVCCDKYKLSKYRNYQFSSYDRLKPEFQQNDPNYVDMNRSKTFSYSDRPRIFSPLSVKSETFTHE